MENNININIKQPNSFDDKHDSLELNKALDSLKQATNNIEQYKESFVNSFIKTADEVIEYIPKNQIDKYTLCEGYIDIFDKEYVFGHAPKIVEYSNKITKAFDEQITSVKTETDTNGRIYTIPTSSKIKEKIYDLLIKENDLHNNIKRKIDKCETLIEKLKWINPNQKVFVVDNVNKKIELLWGLDEPDIHKTECERNAKFKKGILIGVEDESLIAGCNMSFTRTEEYPAPNAIFISTDNVGYYNKKEYSSYTTYLDVIHKFNIRNNKYEGIIENGFIQ